MILQRTFLFIALCTAFISSTAHARKALDISVLSEDIRADVTKRFPMLEKDKLTLEQIDEVIRYLQLKPQMNDIQVIEDSSSAPYRLSFSQTRTIGNVTIVGLQNISESEARNIFNVKTGEVFYQQALIDDAERLRQAYKDRGFFNAIIDIEMPPGPNNTVDLVVKVSENRQTKIERIRMQSANEELNQKVLKKVNFSLREPLTEAELTDITKSVRAYLTKNRYVRTEMIGPNIEYSADESQAVLNYRLEKVDQYFIEYTGANAISARTLNNTLDIDNFSSASPSVGGELATKIKNYYLTQGYARVEVSHEEAESSRPFQKRIILRIEEGPRIKIQKIVITGKVSRESAYYAKALQALSSKVVADGFYNKEDLDSGVKNLILQLQNEGFLQSRIISSRTQYNKERDQLTFHLNLDEGPMTQIEKVEFTGNTSFKPEQLLEVTQLRPQGPLKLNQIDIALNALKNFYREQGYIEMYITNKPEELVKYDSTNTLASLNFQIFEGPKVQVASIVLEGNTFTKDYVLLNELEFKTGELLTPSKIDESVARLQKTGYFGSAEISTLEEKTMVSDRTVIVKVSERDPGLFTVGAGATNERGVTLRGYTGASYRNLFGTGRGVSLRLEGNYNVSDVKFLEHRVILGYLEPYLFNTRVRGRINVTRATTVTDYDLHQATELNSTTYSLEKDFTSHILGIWDVWSLATVRDFGIDDQFPANLALTQDIATTGPTVDIDFRDNPFNPTKGTFTRLNAEYSDPIIGSTRTIKYVRSTASFTHYQTVDRWKAEPVVWANQIRGGYLRNLSSEADGGVPWDKKGFILGGQSTLRGYEAGSSEVFPNYLDLGIPEKGKYLLTTSAEMFLIKSELRFPVWGSLGGAVFYDGGSVRIAGLNIVDSYRDSAGVGIRYSTPVGPLSLEWAWKLDAKQGEEPWRFHLSIGTF